MPEVRRLVCAVTEAPERLAARLAWSAFRRHHQAIANRGHAARRARDAPTDHPSPTVQILAASDLTLTAERWARIEPLLPPSPARGRPPHDHRPLVAGMLWVAQTGAAWRDLPEQFGPWQTVHNRYQRWRQAGLWQEILDALQAKPPADTS